MPSLTSHPILPPGAYRSVRPPGISDLAWERADLCARVGYERMALDMETMAFAEQSERRKWRFMAYFSFLRGIHPLVWGILFALWGMGLILSGLVTGISGLLR